MSRKSRVRRLNEPVGQLRTWLASAIALGILCSRALGQDAQVRTSFQPDDGALLVGQKGTLVVELLAPGFFAGAPAFDLPNVPGMVIIPPAGSPVISNLNEGEVSFTVQRHEIPVFLHREGNSTVLPFKVRFAFKRAPLDKDTVPANLSTDAVPIKATMPPGAEGLSNLICANELSIDEHWDPQPGNAKAGDAFTRTITFTADDIPGMAFPPFPPSAPEGVRAYVKQPQVRDRVERGEISGMREDEITYVCQKPGRFIIPAARFTWWDLDDKQLKAIDFPRQALNVAEDPVMARRSGGLISDKEFAETLHWSVSSKRTAWLIIFAGVALLCAVGIAHRRHWLRAGVAYLKPVKLAPLNPP